MINFFKALFRKPMCQSPHTSLDFNKQLVGLFRKINQCHQPEEILGKLFDDFQSFIPYERLGFARISGDLKYASLVWVRDKNQSPEALKTGYKAKMLGSSLQTVIDTLEPRIINDLSAYLVKNPSSLSTRLVVKDNMKSSLTCPLIVKNKPVGFLFFSSIKIDTYAHVHVETYREIADIIATALEKGFLFQEIDLANRRKDEVMGMVAHDLKNQLHRISGFSQLLLLDPELPKNSLKLAQPIYDATRGMLNTINDLAETSQIEAGVLTVASEIIQLTDLLEARVNSFRLQAEKKAIGLNFEIKNLLPVIIGDGDKLSRVFDNLLSNAIKYSPSKGVIQVTVEKVGNMISIQVNDQGLGIPADDFDTIFEWFGKSTAQPTGGESSTGLGLFIAKQFIEAHNGSIAVQSEMGVGSTFMINLPIPN